MTKEEARLRMNRLEFALSCLEGMYDACMFSGDALGLRDRLERQLDEERLRVEDEYHRHFEAPDEQSVP